MKLSPESPPQIGEFARVEDRLAALLAGEWHVNRRPDATRTPGHDDDDVCEQDGFVKIVRHEYRGGCSLRRQDAQQLELHLSSCQGIQCTEWFIHEQDLGLHQ